MTVTHHALQFFAVFMEVRTTSLWIFGSTYLLKLPLLSRHSHNTDTFHGITAVLALFTQKKPF